MKTFTRVALFAYLLLVLFQNPLASQMSQRSAVVQRAGTPVVVNWSSLPLGPPSFLPGTEPPPVGVPDADKLQNLKNQPFIHTANPAYKEEPDTSVGSRASQSSLRQPHLTRPMAPDLNKNGESIDSLGNSLLHLLTAQGPPDPVIAAGPNHIMVVVNSTLVVYNKSGSELQRTSLATWFSSVCSGCDPFDPRIAYDQQNGHWLLMALARNESANPQESWYLLSVSQTADPTGAWWNYKLTGRFVYKGVDPNGEATWADYPDLGFDGISDAAGGAVYITSNQFTFAKVCGNNDEVCFRTTLVNILPKSQLYKGGTAFSYWEVYDTKDADGSLASTLRAAHTFGDPGGEFLINTKSGGGDSVTVHRVNPTYPPTPLDMTLQATVFIGNYGPSPSASQAGCTDLLDTQNNRMYNAIYRDGGLYSAFTQAQDWGSGKVAAIRYLKINTSTNNPELNIVYGADGYNYFYPAIYTDSSDNIVLVFARSNSNEYASIRYTGRTTSDIATQSSEQLKGGTACISKASDATTGRFGDYFGIAQDPADANRIWIYGEWAKDSIPLESTSDWGTWFGQTSFSSVPPPATRIKFRGTVQSIGGDQSVPIYNTLVQTVIEGPANLAGSTLPVTDFGAVISCSGSGSEVSPNIQAGTKVEVFGKLDGTAVSVECSPDYIKSILKLTVTKAGAGSGMVSGTGIDCGSDCAEEYFYSTSVSLNAAASAGSVFTGWSGACGGTSTCKVTMDANKTVIANFSPPNGPDLAGYFSSIKVTCKEGRRPKYQIAAKLTISNNGNVAVNQPFFVDYYLSEDSNLDGGDSWVGDKRLKNKLKPGKSTSVSTTLELDSCPRGKRLLAHLDSTDNVAERDETNNIVSSSGAVAAPPASLGLVIPIQIAGIQTEVSQSGKGRLVSFVVQGSGISQVDVEVFSLAGARVFEGIAKGLEITWDLTTDNSRVVPNSVYIYVVTARGFNGEVVRSQVKKLVILR